MLCQRSSERLGASRGIDRCTMTPPFIRAVLLCTLLVASCGEDSGPPTEPPDPPGPTPGFQIEIRYVEGTEPTEEQRGYFDAAVERWEQAIVGDLDEVYVSQPTPFTCQKLMAPAMDEEIDDLVVYVEIGPLDGPWPGIGSDEGWAVGWGGPCVLRDNYLPAVSSITIDIEELYRLGDFTWLVIHELGHALGFGEVWRELGLLSDPSDPIHGAPGPIEAGEDATISSYYADQNFGLPDGTPLSENLVVGENLGMWTDGPDDELLSFLLRFELPDMITVPPSGATLVLYSSAAFDESEPAINSYHNLSDWSEAEVTWETKPERNNASYFDRWHPEFGTLTQDVSQAAREWFTTGNYGLVFETGLLPPGYSQGFFTRHAADPNLRPQLILIPDTYFAGPAAIAAFDEIGGDEYEGGKVPVDNDYPGPTELGGSSDGHWRRTVLRGEIMNPVGGGALSILTIASMEDMGYEVDLNVADHYSFPTPISQQLPASDLGPIDGTGAGPWYRVGSSGQLSIVRRH